MTPTELGYVHSTSVTSAIQTQLDMCIKNNSSTTLTCNIGLINSGNNQFTFAGALPMELGYGYSVISAIQTQLDNCIKTYTMAGATPTKISRLSGVTSAIQTL